jgi:tetratricopeptide (TPR) repeat protein
MGNGTRFALRGALVLGAGVGLCLFAGNAGLAQGGPAGAEAAKSDAGKAGGADAPRAGGTEKPAKAAVKQDEAAVAAAMRLNEFGEPGLAEQRLRRALNVDPQSRPVLKALAALALEARDADASLAYAKTWSTLEPADVGAHLAVMEAAFYDAGRYSLPPEAGGSADAAKMYGELTGLAVMHAGRALTLLGEAQKGAGGAGAAGGDKGAVIAPKGREAARAEFFLGEIDRIAAGDLAARDPSARLKVAGLRESALGHYKAALLADGTFTDAMVPAALTAMQAGRAADAIAQLDAFDAAEKQPTFAGLEIRAQALLALSPPDYAGYAKVAAQLKVLSPSNERCALASLATRLVGIAGSGLAREIVDVAKACGEVEASQRLQLVMRYCPDVSDVAVGGKPGGEKPKRERPIVPEFCYYASDAAHQIGRTMPVAADAEGMQRQALALIDRTGLDAKEYAELEAAVPDLARLRAFIQLSLKDYKAAESAFKRVMELDGADPRAPLYAEIMPEVAAGHVTTADFEKFLSLREASISGVDRLNYLKGMCTQVPNFAILRCFVGGLLYDLSDFAGAALHYGAAVKVHADYKEALYGAARCAMRLGDWIRAGEQFGALLKLAPDYRQAGQLFAFVKRVNEGTLNGGALSAYLKALPDSETEPSRRDLLDRAITTQPDFVEAILERAALAVRDAEGRPGQQGAGEAALEYAAGLCDRVIEKASGDVLSRAHATAADIAARRGKYEDSLKHYREARALVSAAKEPDAVRLASLDYLQATVHFVAGQHADADAILQTSASRKLPATMLPSRHAIDRITGLREFSEARRELTPGLRKGQRLTFIAQPRIAREGGDSPESATGAFDVVCEVKAVPAVGGLWEMLVSFAGVPAEGSFAALKDAPAFTLKVSPWFGPVGSPFSEDTPAARASLLIVQGLTELLTIAPGTATIPMNMSWSRAGVPGLMHLGADYEACYVESAEAQRVVIRRLAVNNFRDEMQPRMTWPARHRIESRVELDGLSQYPKSVNVKMTRAGLTEAKDDVETRVAEIGLMRRE